MEQQSKKLINMLNVVIARLDRLDELKDDIRKLAVRHTGYGVRPAHYELVGTALIWTLKTALSAEWNDTLEKSWVKCYTTLSSTMITAADEESKAA
jgi:hemoglobin-like flavoprotein